VQHVDPKVSSNISHKLRHGNPDPLLCSARQSASTHR
jgi:hypothetical protein